MSYTRLYTRLCIFSLFFLIFLIPTNALTDNQISLLNNISYQNNISNTSYIAIFTGIEQIANFNDTESLNSSIKNLTLSVINLQLEVTQNYYNKSYIDLATTQLRNDLRNGTYANLTINKYIDNSYVDNITAKFYIKVDELENQTDTRIRNSQNYTENLIIMKINQSEYDTNNKLILMAKNFDSMLLRDTIIAIIVSIALTLLALFLLRGKNFFIRDDAELKAIIRKIEMIIPPAENMKYDRRELTLNKVLRDRQTRIRQLKLEIYALHLPRAIEEPIIQKIDDDVIKNISEAQEEIKVSKIEFDNENKKKSNVQPKKNGRNKK